MTMEPMEKWRSGESFEQIGMGFKDALLNKGRVERERKRAAKEAARRARRQSSLTGRLTAWLGRMIRMAFALCLIAGVGFVGYLSLMAMLP